MEWNSKGKEADQESPRNGGGSGGGGCASSGAAGPEGKQRLCLRHVGSGRYLAVDVNGKTSKGGLQLTMKDKLEEGSCVFSLEPIETRGGDDDLSTYHYALIAFEQYYRGTGLRHDLNDDLAPAGTRRVQNEREKNRLS